MLVTAQKHSLQSFILRKIDKSWKEIRTWQSDEQKDMFFKLYGVH